MESGDTFVVLWSQDRVKWLRKCGDEGPLEVVFGGPHISQPSIEKVRVGDVICPLAARKGKLFVLGMLRVEQLVDPDDFVKVRLGINRDGVLMWNDIRYGPHGTKYGHRIPQTCADLAAKGTGTNFAWDTSVPPESLGVLRFGPKAGKELPLKGVSDGLLKSILSFHGHVRRASKETGEILKSIVRNSGLT